MLCESCGKEIGQDGVCADCAQAATATEHSPEEKREKRQRKFSKLSDIFACVSLGCFALFVASLCMVYPLFYASSNPPIMALGAAADIVFLLCILTVNTAPIHALQFGTASFVFGRLCLSPKRKVLSIVAFIVGTVAYLLILGLIVYFLYITIFVIGSSV